jgi:Ran GTPase-activating protein (RanGAP) involved in mRNA processing and transport
MGDDVVPADRVAVEMPQADETGHPACKGIYLDRLTIADDEICTSICRSSKECVHLELVDCQGPRIPHLVENVLKLPSLQQFALRRVTSTDLEDSFRVFATIGLRFLQELRLEVQLSEGSSRLLAEALDSSNGCSVTRLCMQKSSFSNSQAVEALAQGGFQKNRSLESLDLSYCRLRDDDLKVIMKTLPPTIQVLDLALNYCRSDGMAAIVAILLQEDHGLESLNLTNQHPGEFGGTLDLSLLGLAVMSNHVLRHLDVSFNLLTTNDLSNLVAALSKNTTLESINLMSNQLDDHTMLLIGNYLPRMRGLQKLTITANRFGEDGANALLQGLMTNVYLAELSMPRGFDASDGIDYYLALNRGGRRLLLEKKRESIVPLGLWSLIFERVNSLYQSQPSMCASVLVHLLKGPVLFGRKIEDLS